MRSETPFFCITVSSSFVTSSNVKPYCRPEQPPPVTKTRSLRSLLPSSSIRAFTLFAALSVKSSGSGIAVDMSFMRISPGFCVSSGGGGGGFQFHHLFALLGAFVLQLPHDDGAHVDLDRLVRDIPCDAGLGKEFDILGAADGACHRAVDDHVGHVDLAFHLRQLGQHQRAGLVAGRADVALDMAIDAKPAGEADVALDRRAGPDQTVDRAWLVGLPEHIALPRAC